MYIRFVNMNFIRHYLRINTEFYIYTNVAQADPFIHISANMKS